MKVQSLSQLHVPLSLTLRSPALCRQVVFMRSVKTARVTLALLVGVYNEHAVFIVNVYTYRL